MYLTLTNTTHEAETFGTPDGSFVDVLHPSASYAYREEDGHALIIGDKPEGRAPFARAAGVLDKLMQQLLNNIAGRKAHAAKDRRPEHITVAIANHGTVRVRAFLGAAGREIDIEPGKILSLTAPGFIELRELAAHVDEEEGDAIA